jgi:XTP/dITP diphosphohydrolase
MQLVLATANPDKVGEIEAIFAEVGVPGLELLARPRSVPDVEETGATLLANARLKALALSRATGLGALADDTGLEVDALGGKPGVHSARFAGIGATYAQNVEKLLADLISVGALSRGARSARFTTVAFALLPDGTELHTVGMVEGTLAMEPAGEGGFGYDSVFVPDEADGRTFAEMTSQEKHAISHRGRAMRALARLLGSP